MLSPPEVTVVTALLTTWMSRVFQSSSQPEIVPEYISWLPVTA